MFALSLSEIGLYSFALLLLFIMPGPVWVALIALISALVPFSGNLILGLAVGRARQLISSVSARRRLNQVSGVILILVGGLILVTT